MEEDKLKKIQEAAVKVFSQKGYKETKIVDIAKLAEISPGTIYLYFKNKKELFSSLNIPEAEQLRPKYDEKRLEILRVALSMFGINGYNATSMEAIASACGFSKAVLYQYFNNKEELFTAIFEEEVIKEFKILSIDDEDKNLHEILTKVAYTYYESITRPEKLNLIRVIMAESGKFPQIGRILYDNAINVVAARLSIYFEKFKESGIIDCSNTKLYARNFMGNIMSFVIVDKLINPENNEFDKDDILKSIVNTYERGMVKK
ncbi:MULTISPECIES: TetR/AcrR family transcriptional regulator [unclassified Clostridium]|uniref:TetR/AcrR family transcriptional regulator n=1 Tax=unclassified Clostridium TaxID=2614128 RepID=UPI0002981D74|nr:MULTISPECIES: TetR/AcrR family transcriptional regulator [unclassified Clostridium]EKQ51569.1 MAG: transcriptional regulator [Clostridium sp. Maddingley MBC34-26]